MALEYLEGINTIIKPVVGYNGYFADEQGVIFSTVQNKKDPYRMHIYYHLGRNPTVRIKKQHVDLYHIMALAWFPDYNPLIHQVLQRPDIHHGDRFKVCGKWSLFIIDKGYNERKHKLVFRNGFDNDYRLSNLNYC